MVSRKGEKVLPSPKVIIMSIQKFIARKAFVADLIELLQLNTDAHGAICINTNSVEKLDSFYEQIDQYDQDNK